MDVVVVRPCRRGGYELLDHAGGYVGCALTLAAACRFADAVGIPMAFSPEDGMGPARLTAASGWRDGLRALTDRIFHR